MYSLSTTGYGTRCLDTCSNVSFITDINKYPLTSQLIVDLDVSPLQLQNGLMDKENSCQRQKAIEKCHPSTEDYHRVLKEVCYYISVFLLYFCIMCVHIYLHIFMSTILIIAL